MCGFCLAPSKDCDSYLCKLNPMPSYEGENYSINRKKTMMVLRAYRSALALAGATPGARRAALVEAAPAWAECAEDGVGRLLPDEPWLFNEQTTPEQDEYMTPS